MAKYEMEKIENIKTHPTFEGIFRIDQELLARIEQDMRDGRYDISQPIILATWEGQKELVCIDGHTRLQAAKNAGIEEVPVFTHELDTEQEAIEKAIKLQRNRRNMTDAEIFTCIQTLDKKKPRGGDRRSEEAKSKTSDDAINKSGSKSASETAEILGISTSKVERTRSVLNHGDPETIEAVKNSEMSINQACQKTRETKSKRNKTNKTKPNSSTKNSKREATDECQEPQQGVTGTEVKETAPVFIDMSQYKALFELGGVVDDHVEKAIDLYLQSLKEKNGQDLAEKDQVAEANRITKTPIRTPPMRTRKTRGNQMMMSTSIPTVTGIRITMPTSNHRTKRRMTTTNTLIPTSTKTTEVSRSLI